jgi:cobalt-zinc-cadmium efflux system outer membrane protein
MNSIAAAAGAVAMTLVMVSPLAAQVGNPATPQVGRPMSDPPVGPPAPPQVLPLVPRSGPLPANLNLIQALDEAGARSPAIVAAERDVAAAEARVRQAGYRSNPELSVEIENVAGTGELRGLSRMETTVAVNQRLDLGGRRGARVEVARAELEVQRLRLAIARADLFQSVREQFAQAIAARERLAQAQDNVAWAQELARVAGLLVDAGRDPPLRAVRARSALAQARATLEAAKAEELAARSSLAALFGVSTPVSAVTGSSIDLIPRQVVPETSLEVRLMDAERTATEAGLRLQLAERRLDPAVGAGVRHVRETGDFGFVAGVSMPLQIFDRNQGNITAARASVAAADARRAGALASTTAKARNAIVNVEAAERRVSALDKSAIPEAAEALRLTERSYEEGRASLLELLDARNAYTAAQAQLTEARLALARATAELGRISVQQEPSR